MCLPSLLCKKKKTTKKKKKKRRRKIEFIVAANAAVTKFTRNRVSPTHGTTLNDREQRINRCEALRAPFDTNVGLAPHFLVLSLLLSAV